MTYFATSLTQCDSAASVFDFETKQKTDCCIFLTTPPPSLQVKDFDSISRLDQWHTTLLLRIKKTIQGDEGDLK